MWDAPVKDGVAKGAHGAVAAEEQVPNRVRERFGLRVGREADDAGRTAEGEGDDLACLLAHLDVVRHVVALGERGALEDGVTRGAAGLSCERNGETVSLSCADGM